MLYFGPGRGKEHSGERFAAAKKGAGGDVKGTSRYSLRQSMHMTAY